MYFNPAHKAQVAVTGAWEILTNSTVGTNEGCKMHEVSRDKSSCFQLFVAFYYFT